MFSIARTLFEPSVVEFVSSRYEVDHLRLCLGMWMAVELMPESLELMPGIVLMEGEGEGEDLE